MEVHVPEDLGPVMLYTLAANTNVTVFEEYAERMLTCAGEIITVTDVEIGIDGGADRVVKAVRIESDVEEDGYYIDAHHVGL